MNKEEKIKFIEDVLNGTKKQLIERIDDIPEEWDGYELRRWIAETIDEQYNYMKMSNKRARDYNNTRLTKNL
jgi:hypothetical protein